MNSVYGIFSADNGAVFDGQICITFICYNGSDRISVNVSMSSKVDSPSIAIQLKRGTTNIIIEQKRRAVCICRYGFTGGRINVLITICIGRLKSTVAESIRRSLGIGKESARAQFNLLRIFAGIRGD
ncbi:MAG TPA: hypothetical protein H9682_08005 [Firmicutes bacterium]|nr:hypothetical protein [Bacillota bacterium]